MTTKSNMYDWIDRTKNFIRGECPHKCSYCYVKASRVKHLYEEPPKLIESQFKSLGSGHFYFIGSMIDMFAEKIPTYSILKILKHCRKYKNKYLFQSKNPWRFNDVRTDLPPNIILGTTIETNRLYYPHMGYTPTPTERSVALYNLSDSFETMVTIEPIMDFSVDIMVNLVLSCNPQWVNIGADSKGHNLPEPSSDKVKELIGALKENGIEVKIKSNLKRLIKDEDYIIREFSE